MSISSVEVGGFEISVEVGCVESVEFFSPSLVERGVEDRESFVIREVVERWFGDKESLVLGKDKGVGVGRVIRGTTPVEFFNPSVVERGVGDRSIVFREVIERGVGDRETFELGKVERGGDGVIWGTSPVWGASGAGG